MTAATDTYLLDVRRLSVELTDGRLRVRAEGVNDKPVPLPPTKPATPPTPPPPPEDAVQAALSGALGAIDDLAAAVMFHPDPERAQACLAAVVMARDCVEEAELRAKSRPR